MRPQTPNSRSQAGRRGQPRAVRRAPCASLSRRTRQSARPRPRAVPGKSLSAPLRCESRSDLAAEQSAARRGPAGCPALAGPRGPAPGRLPSHTPWAPRPAASCWPTLDAMHWRPATPPPAAHWLPESTATSLEGHWSAHQDPAPPASPATPPHSLFPPKV